MIGAGGWGTALTHVLSKKHDSLFLYCRNEKKAEKLRKTRINEEYLPGVILSDTINISSDLENVVKDADCVILCTPSKAVESTVTQIEKYLKKDAITVCASKGLADNKGTRLSQVIAKKLSKVTNKIVALSGPNHAEEVGEDKPCATVAASCDEDAVRFVQDIFMSPMFRVYRSDDICGVEYAGALKNIIALACGVQDGLGLGDNCRAALMTRGLTEITRFGISFNAKMSTFLGLAGMGDLIATCTSIHSRNYRAGRALSEGKTAKEIIESTSMVVEGIRTAKLVNEIAERKGIDMPITKEICHLLEGKHSPQESLEVLMTRAKKSETEGYLFDKKEFFIKP